MAQRYPEARRGGEEAPDRWGSGVSGREREDTADGRREIKKKTYFAKYAKDACGPSGYEASGPGSRWLGGLGRPASQGRWGLWPGRLRLRPRKRIKRISELKLDFSNLARL
jgi:hypothetical protein